MQSVTYCKKAEVDSLKKRFDEFASIENIAELQNVMLPKVRHFSE
jgi:hypothetical protein